ncbi:NADPH-dependent FMN reductase [Lutibacter sp.]|uniref:NADPH-dependent FMN reductase n=1 Tax=Lutibacter sp. TaxID=1925666 RepID=UPI003564BAD9
MTKNIVTIGGSSSKNSINKILAEYAGGLLKNAKLTKVDLNDFEMPLFSVDVEAEKGYSKGVLTLNEIFENADGFVISLAEHNGAYSAAFKNAFDWLSRIEGKVWRNKPMLLLSTSPGIRGGKSVLEIALGKFPYMGANIIGSMSFPLFNENFKEGEIVNSDLKENLQNLVDEFENAL